MENNEPAKRLTLLQSTCLDGWRPPWVPKVISSLFKNWRNRKAPHPAKTIAFILSSDRSGSTWVGYVLGSGRENAFLGEYYRGWDENLRVPCSWCAVHGKEKCDVLHGFEEEPAASAFDFAFSRTGKSLLVDNSKRPEWAKNFITTDGSYGLRLIHLIRDPRGWYASERRRKEASLSELLADWVEENRNLRDFLEQSGVPGKTVFYDELAASPTPGFTDLCSFLGRPFEPRSLKYWEKPHHGFAANGASSLFLKGAPQASRLTTFVTGDDAYYAKQGHGLFTDERWKQQLNADDLRSIKMNNNVTQLLALYGRTLAPEGLARL